MKIGILGGTFDPVHVGHLALATYAIKQFKLDKVFFVLSARPPHKQAARPMSSVRHRLAMLKLAVGDSKKMIVSNLEVRRPGPSYMVRTLKKLRKMFPREKLYLVLGQDSYGSLNRWHRPDEIKKMVRFLVARRPGCVVPKHAGTRTAWIRMPPLDIASSKIRKNFVVKTKEMEMQLSPKVADYVRRHRLYRKGV